MDLEKFPKGTGMVTDPIRAIRAQEHETELDLNVHEAMLRLAALPPSSDLPYLSVSLDWRSDGTNPARVPAPNQRPSERQGNQSDSGTSHRPSRALFEREAKTIVDALGPRGEAFDSLTEDIARISDFLDQSLDPSAQGVFFVACSGRDVFEVLALGLPVETRVSVGAIPALSVLVQLEDDYPTFAALLADQHDATLSFIAQSNVGQSISLTSSTYPRKQMQGGWSQRRFQSRADERVDAFARGIAVETQSALDDLDVGMLVIAGDEVITSALDAMFHQSVKERTVGTLRLDIDTSERDLVLAAQPLIDQTERQREADAVQAVLDGIGMESLGAGGAAPVLLALLAGQVSTLVLNDDFAAAGWADYGFPLAGAGEIPSEHPAAGDVANIIPIDLREEMIRLALSTGAAVQVVKSAGPIPAAELDVIPDSGEPAPRSDPATALDGLGGVGAVLRFA